MRILIIHRFPLGYLTDALKLCEYLSRRHKVTFLSFDSLDLIGNSTVSLALPSVQVQASIETGPLFRRFSGSMKRCINEAGKDYDLIYVYYFRGCSIVRLMHPTKRIVVDFRSGAVSTSWVKRRLGELLMKVEARRFERVTVISEWLRDKLNVPTLRAHVLPLGADCPDVPVKRFDSLHLLYVGTLEARRIDHTIEGFAHFYEQYHDQLNLRYTIVGDGRNSERGHLIKLAGKYGIQSVIDFPGYIPHERLGKYWRSCNVGVSYVPITTYFDHQPPTKTYEYLLAGMPVIATGTAANRQIIADSNGIIIQDTARSFYQGLCELMRRKGHYDSTIIRQSVAEHTWNHIMLKNAIPYVEDMGKL